MGSKGSRLTLLMLIFLCLLVGSPPTIKAESPFIIRINIPARRLDLLWRGMLVKEYPVAVGKTSTPSQLGFFHIANKVVNPTWYPEGKIPVEPGPDNPVGTRWLGLNLAGYGIHGTNNPSSIGKAVSGGCFRMHNKDIEEIHSIVPVGTPVQLTYETVEVTRAPGDLSPIQVRVHPDIYKREAKGKLEQLQEILELSGVRDVSASILKELTAKEDGVPRTYPLTYTAQINGITFDFDLKEERGRLLVDTMSLTKILGAERVGLTGFGRLMELDWAVGPETVASILGLGVSLDLEEGQVNFTAPIVTLESGAVHVCKVDYGSGQVETIPGPFTLVFPEEEELPFPRIPVAFGDNVALYGVYLIGGSPWMDLTSMKANGIDLPYSFDYKTGQVVIEGENYSAAAYRGRPLVPLTVVRKALDPLYVTDANL